LACAIWLLEAILPTERRARLCETGIFGEPGKFRAVNAGTTPFKSQKTRQRFSILGQRAFFDRSTTNVMRRYFSRTGCGTRRQALALLPFDPDQGLGLAFQKNRRKSLSKK
jgi:hypothetical protein